MAYNTKPIVTDVDGNPISQYYNPETDQYEPVEGKNGANKVLVMNNDLSLQPILDKLDQLTGTVIDEETRKSNEIERQNNEQNRIQLYNALLAELERIEQIEQQVPESVLEAVDNLKNEIGNLLELQTNEKSNLIGAINEINQKVENIEVVDMEAINVSYDNAESGLAANNIQEAIDEINTKIDEIEIVDMDAVNVSYDNTESEIEAENVQDAIDEINENLTAHKADGVHGRVEATNTDDATSIVDAPLKSAGGLAVAKRIIVGEGIELNRSVNLPLPIPPRRGSIIHYSFSLPDTDWTTVVDVGSNDYAIQLTGLIGGSNRRSVRGFSLIYGRGGNGNFDPYLILFGGSEEFIRLDGTALQFRSQWAGYGLTCHVFLSRIL